MSLWRKRQLFRKLAELPRQQVTSPYSCMILIISHMAEGAEPGGVKSQAGRAPRGATQRPAGHENGGPGEVGAPSEPPYLILWLLSLLTP